MARPVVLEDNFVVSVRIEKSMYHMLSDLAALETINTGHVVSVQKLIRDGLNFVYGDNEMLRESFRRSRSHMTKRARFK